jgi:hypothetical protein
VISASGSRSSRGSSGRPRIAAWSPSMRLNSCTHPFQPVGTDRGRQRLSPRPRDRHRGSHRRTPARQARRATCCQARAPCRQQTMAVTSSCVRPRSASRCARRRDIRRLVEPAPSQTSSWSQPITSASGPAPRDALALASASSSAVSCGGALGLRRFLDRASSTAAGARRRSAARRRPSARAAWPWMTRRGPAAGPRPGSWRGGFPRRTRRGRILRRHAARRRPCAWHARLPSAAARSPPSPRCCAGSRRSPASRARCRAARGQDLGLHRLGVDVVVASWRTPAAPISRSRWRRISISAFASICSPTTGQGGSRAPAAGSRRARAARSPP